MTLAANVRLVLGYEGHAARKARKRIVGFFSERFRNGRLLGFAIGGKAIAYYWYHLR